MTDLPSQNLISATEVAVLLGVTERSVWNWLRRECIPAPAQQDGTTRWSRAEIEAWNEYGRPTLPGWKLIQARLVSGGARMESDANDPNVEA